MPRKTQGGPYHETITGEDRMETCKLMAIRCEVQGIVGDWPDFRYSAAGTSATE